MGIYRKEEQVPPRFVSARRSDDSVAIASVLRVFLEKCWKFIIISIRTNERRRNYFSNFLSQKLCRQQINEEKRRWKKCWWRWREDVYLNSRQLFSAYQVLLRLSAQVFPSFFFLKKRKFKNLRAELVEFSDLCTRPRLSTCWTLRLSISSHQEKGKLWFPIKKVQSFVSATAGTLKFFFRIGWETNER